MELDLGFYRVGGGQGAEASVVYTKPRRRLNLALLTVIQRKSKKSAINVKSSQVERKYVRLQNPYCPSMLIMLETDAWTGSSYGKPRNHIPSASTPRLAERL